MLYLTLGIESLLPFFGMNLIEYPVEIIEDDIFAYFILPDNQMTPYAIILHFEGKIDPGTWNTIY